MTTNPWIARIGILIFVAVLIFTYSLYVIPRNFDEASIIPDVGVDLNQEDEVDIQKVLPNLAHEDLKYILQWTSPKTAPFDFMGKGRSAFIKNDCEYTNCYVTDDKDFFIDPTDFDVVAFNGKDVVSLKQKHLPAKRSPKQIFLFGAMESPHYYPVCNNIFNNFFNWTWTYKLDSDFRWGYVTIYDLYGTVVGPKTDMVWPEMDPISDDLKVRLDSKTKVAAWFVSNCKSKSEREVFLKEVQKELQPYSLSVDVYGSCGDFKCPRSKQNECSKLLEKHYLFYFSFENSFAEDYVTEKLLTAVQNLAVPVVYGGANYSRFLPPGSYLNGKELGAKALAKEMHDIMENRTRYYDFFRWTNHYRYKETSNNEDVCKLCEMINDSAKVEKVSVYGNFKEWWNGKLWGSC